jgi:hypothetical protein
MKRVNKYTRAGRDGRTIYCPECNAPNTVYHFSWSAITCGGCQQMIGKYYFSTKPRHYRSNQGRNPHKEKQIMILLKVAMVLLLIAILTTLILR